METTETPTQPKPSYGAAIGLLIIVAAIVLGAFYVLKERVNEGARYETLEAQSDSTDPDAIQADLEAQSSNEFDGEIDQAFVEMEAAFEAE